MEKPSIRNVVTGLSDEMLTRVTRQVVMELLAQAAEAHLALEGYDAPRGSSSNTFLHLAERAWMDQAKLWGWQGYQG